MAPRPAKRQRRSTIILSDNSDADLRPQSPNSGKGSLQREITREGRTSANVSPAKTAKSRPVAKKTSVKPSPTSTPEKTRKSATVKDEPVKTRSLHTFFAKASDEQRWQKKSHTPEAEVENNAELSDAIEDDDLSDETLQELGFKNGKANTALERRQSSILSTAGSLKSSSNGAGLPSSQRFVKPALPARNGNSNAKASDAESEGHRPWADRYQPVNLDELMVHKKKLTDVQNWLQGKVDDRHSQRLLVLKGPAGSGKTTTVSLIAKTMSLQLVPWQNPDVSTSGPDSSVSAQFDDFLNRGGQFGSLGFEQDVPSENTTGNTNKQMLMIEEFPATMTRSSNALQSFRSVILRFLARTKSVPATAFQQSSSDASPPVVMIISETLLSSSTALSDSFTAHRLLGPEILNHPYVTAMDFNPIAATFMTKALDLVVKKEARDSRRRRTPGPGVIAKLAEIGDVRSAVNSLEFLCLRGGDGSEWSGTVAAKAKRSSKDNPALTETEKNSLALVSQRETTLDMFHAAGKIVYNKREDPRVLDTRAEPPPKPPDHLLDLYNPKMSQVNIEALLNETGTDIQTFISTLHENYALSCHGNAFEESFDGCSDILSISDILNPESRPNRRGNSSNPNAAIIQPSFQAASSDALRQDEISFHVASRGLLFNLPSPVNRAGASIPGGKRGDAFKMFYPASLRLWKPVEEMQGLLDMFVRDGNAAVGQLATSRLEGAGTDAGVATWRSRNLGAEVSLLKSEVPAQDSLYPVLPKLEEETEMAPLPVTYGKDILTLELLPYKTLIMSAGKHDTSMLEKITKFKRTSYLSVPDEGLEDEDEDMTPNHGVASGMPNTFSQSVSAAVGTSKGLRVTISNVDESSAGVEKMYISEDDIEDE